MEIIRIDSIVVHLSDFCNKNKTFDRRNLMDPLFWLYADNYRTYNVEVARKLKSVNAAIYLSELASRYKYRYEHNELVSHPVHGDGWFYYTDEKCEERTCLSSKECELARALLVRSGLIIKVKFGQPGKNHYKIINENILEFFGFSKKDSSCPKKSHKKSQKEELVVPKRATIYMNYIEEPKYEQKQASEVQSPAISPALINEQKEQAAQMFKICQRELVAIKLKDLEGWIKKHSASKVALTLPIVIQKIKEGKSNGKPVRSHAGLMTTSLEENYAKEEDNFSNNKIFLSQFLEAYDLWNDFDVKLTHCLHSLSHKEFMFCWAPEKFCEEIQKCYENFHKNRR